MQSTRRPSGAALDDYAPWQRPPLDFTFNQFRNVDSGKVVPDADLP